MATDLEYLLSALTQGKQGIEERNPYRGIESASSQLSELPMQLAAQAPGKYGVKELAIASVIPSLFEGIFGGLADNYSTDKTNIFESALRAEMAGQEPEQLDELPSGVREMPAKFGDLFKLNKHLATQEYIKERDRKVEEAGLIKKAEKEGELDAYDEGGGVGRSLLNPANKEARDIVKDYSNRFMKQTADFDVITKNLQTLIAAKSDPSKVSDTDFVFGTMQIIEPGGIVREGEQAMLRATQGLSEGVRRQVMGAWNGTAELGEEAREAMIRLAARRYKIHRAAYTDALSQYTEAARADTGISDPRISFRKDPGTFEDIYGSFYPDSTQPTEATAGTVQTQLKQIEAKLRSGKLSHREKQQLLSQARRLANPIEEVEFELKGMGNTPQPKPWVGSPVK